MHGWRLLADGGEVFGAEVAQVDTWQGRAARGDDINGAGAASTNGTLEIDDAGFSHGGAGAEAEGQCSDSLLDHDVIPNEVVEV